MVTDDMTRDVRRPVQPASGQPASKAARSHSMRSPSTATTSKRHGGGLRHAAQEVARREHEALPLGGADARRGAAEAAVAAHPHLDEDQRAVAVAHDQVDLAAARPRPAATR